MVEKIIKVKQSKNFSNVGSVMLEVTLGRKCLFPNTIANVISITTLHPADSMSGVKSIWLTDDQLLKLVNDILTVGKTDYSTELDKVIEEEMKNKPKDIMK